MKIRTRSLLWMSTSEAALSNFVIASLFLVTVVSVAAAKLTLLRLTPSQIAKIDLVQHRYAATLLGLPPDTAHICHAATEFGWASVFSAVLKAKLLLAGRIFRAESNCDPTTTSLCRLRVAQVEQGDRQGLLGELFILLDCDSNHHLWFHKARSITKGQHKTKVKAFLHAREVAIFESTLRANPNHTFLSLKPSLSRANYLTLPLSQRTLLAQARFSCTNASTDNGRLPSPCRACGHHGSETFFHLSCHCPTFDGPGRVLWSPAIPPSSTSLAWVRMFSLSCDKLISFFKVLDTDFTLITGSPLFSLPSSHDHSACALIARHNAVSTFTSE